MRRLSALLLTIAVTWFVVTRMPAEAAERPAALALGFTLVAAALAGALLERTRLPRVTGYLVFGMVCGPYLANIITRPMARQLQFINVLAVVLIAFIAGLEMNVSRLLPKIRAVLALTGITMALMYLALFAVFWLAWPLLGIAADAGGLQRTALAALLTTIVASFSPTVTIALIAESRARGPVTELTMAVVVLADLVLILAFTLVMQFVRIAFGQAQDVGLFVGLSWEIFGSFAFGAAIGAAFAFYLRHIGRELPIALLGLCACIAGVGGMLHLEPLLAALAAGLVVENIAPLGGDALRDAAERGALPVLVVFFAAAGASLQLDALATIGWVALAVSVLRTGLIWGATRAAARYARVGPPADRLVWLGLVSQAGVTLGLVLIVAGEFPDWGAAMQTLTVALIAIHQLVGPVLFKAGLVRAGEAGRLDEESGVPAEPVELHAD
jgi:Kef-type K+ transport system membrane component KefB